MYVRVTRFEGGDPAVLRREFEEMRQQMEAGLTDEAVDQMAAQVEGKFTRDDVARLLQAIKRTTVFLDADKGSSAMVVYCETEADARGVDELFDAMSPGDGGGLRHSADIYEVAIDQKF